MNLNEPSSINMKPSSNNIDNANDQISLIEPPKNPKLLQEKPVKPEDFILLPKNLALGFESQASRQNLSDDTRFIRETNHVHLFSFLNGTKKGNFYKDRKKYPVPIFLETEKWRKIPILTKSEVLYGLQINDKTGLVLVDPEIVKKFRGLVGEIMKQVFKLIFGSPISLPVRIFEPKSTLSRICEYWSFAPVFLTQAAKASDALERLKLVITFSIAGLYLPTKQLKPFNPNLGETFQGELNDGSKIYAEHICHHPTISNYYLKHKEDLYYLSAFFDFTTATESFGSTIKVYQKGPVSICFKNKASDKVQYCMPTIKLLNSNSENNRSAIWFEDMIFVDVKNNLKAIISFGKDSKYIHGFQGKIINYNFPANYKFTQDQIVQEKREISKANKLPALVNIKGSWLKEICFDNQQSWNIDHYLPSYIIPDEYVIPSDGRFREDLIWLYRSWNAKSEENRKLFETNSQNWKQLIELVQRSDREERKNKRPKK